MALVPMINSGNTNQVVESPVTKQLRGLNIPIRFLAKAIKSQIVDIKQQAIRVSVELSQMDLPE